MLDRLKALEVDRLDIDEAVALLAFGRQMEAQYGELVLSAPEWLGERIGELRREIKTRTHDLNVKRLKELRARRETLEDAATKRTKLDEEIARLEQAATV